RRSCSSGRERPRRSLLGAGGLAGGRRRQYHRREGRAVGGLELGDAQAGRRRVEARARAGQRRTLGGFVGRALLHGRSETGDERRVLRGGRRALEEQRAAARVDLIAERGGSGGRAAARACAAHTASATTDPARAAAATAARAGA